MDLKLDSIISTAWSPWTPPVCWWTPKCGTHGVRDSLIFILNGSPATNVSFHLGVPKSLVEKSAKKWIFHIQMTKFGCEVFSEQQLLAAIFFVHKLRKQI